MENIFETIVGKMPKPKQEDVAKLQQLEAEQRPAPPSTPFAKLPMKDMVLAWQKNPSPENTSAILEKFRPTISSAINSYAQGMDKDLSIKAAKLTLASLKAYNPDMGTEPTTYVFHGLKRLNRLAADRNSIIHYPEQMLAEQAQVKRFMASFEDEKGREPSLGEIADKLGMSLKKIDRLLSTAAVTNDSSMVSEDTGDNLVGAKDLTDEDYFDYVYTSVGPVDQKIMEWTSGLHGKPKLSNNNIAARLRISPAAVSQRKNRIQNMLSEVRGLI